MPEPETLNSIQFPEFVNGSSLWENQFFLPIHQPQIQGNSSSGSEEINRMISNTNTDERKLRRMISNRESARRSRMRKRKQLEDLQGKLSQLRTENRDILGRFLFVSHNVHVMKKENEKLFSEHKSLIQKLSELRRLLLFRQIQCSCSANSCSNMVCINERITSSLIT